MITLDFGWFHYSRKLNDIEDNGGLCGTLGFDLTIADCKDEMEANEGTC